MSYKLWLWDYIIGINLLKYLHRISVHSKKLDKKKKKEDVDIPEHNDIHNQINPHIKWKCTTNGITIYEIGTKCGYTLLFGLFVTGNLACGVHYFLIFYSFITLLIDHSFCLVKWSNMCIYARNAVNWIIQCNVVYCADRSASHN